MRYTDSDARVGRSLCPGPWQRSSAIVPFALWKSPTDARSTHVLHVAVGHVKTATARDALKMRVRTTRGCVGMVVPQSPAARGSPMH